MLGSALLAASLGLFAFSLANGNEVAVARSLAFIAMTAGNLTLVRVIGTRGTTLSVLFARGHTAFWLVAATTIAITMACIAVPVLRGLFQFGVPSATQAAWAAAAGIAAVLVFDLAKIFPAIQKVLGRRGSPADRPSSSHFIRN